MSADLHASVTRIADLEDRSYTIETLAREDWSTGDYIVGRVTQRPKPGTRIENPNGRRVEPMEGETIVGALGTRRATRELVGDWRAVDDRGRLNVLSGGGVLGKVTSASAFASTPIELSYEGHVVQDGATVGMREHGVQDEGSALQTPVVLVIGTSMSAGKTMSARVVARVLREQGRDVVACKLTGAGTYGDVLTMETAGAKAVYDFVDAGLPTTVVPEKDFREAISPLLSRIGDQDADVVVAEVGASPLEPYNGATAIDMLGDQIAFTVLCASDPYAAVGLEQAFGPSPDLVAGIATNTSAGIDLVDELTGCEALNLVREDSKEPLAAMLAQALA